VVVVEDLAGLFNVQHVGRLLHPGQLREPLEVGPHDLVLCHRRVHPLQPLKFPRSRFAGLGGQRSVVDPLVEVLDLVLFLVLFAELLFDRVELLTQDVLALLFAELALDRRLQLARNFEDLILM